MRLSEEIIKLFYQYWKTCYCVATQYHQYYQIMENKTDASWTSFINANKRVFREPESKEILGTYIQTG